MQYTNYERKIAKIADFLKWIYKNRFKIIISLSSIVMVVTSLIVAKGSVISETQCAASIVYGEEPGYTAKAFLSKTYYEYCSVDGSDWTTDIPIVPGSYKVRAAAKSSFGIRYSKPQVFTLLARGTTVQIADKSVQYGDLPKVVADLLDGDKIICNDFEYDEGRSTAKAKADAITILNSDGVDVTTSYSITAEVGEIVTVPREITISVSGGEKVYDGAPLSAEGYEITGGTVVEGDVLNAELVGTITNVGSIAASLDYSFIDDNGEDVTRFYAVTLVEGTLSVSARPITLSSESYEGTYNGATHANNTACISSGDLADGDVISFTEWASTTNACSIENAFVGVICNAEGDDVTSNYAITYSFGAISVGKKILHVYTSSFDAVYNGSYHSSNNYDIDGLASGDVESLTSWMAAIDAGEYKNTCTVAVKSSTGEVVTGNYDIICSFGTITVSKRDLRVETQNVTEVYSGQSYFNNTLTVVGGELAPNDSFYVIEYTKKTSAGTCDNEVSFAIKSNTRDCLVTDNYSISLELGKITILKRPITVLSATDSFDYDAQYHSNGGVEVLGEYGLAAGHTIEVINKTSVRDVDGDVPNVVEVIIKSLGQNVTSNYEINYTHGTLTVIRRSISVTTGSAEKYYDGTPLYCRTATSYGLVTGHEFVVKETSGAVYAGYYSNVLYEYDILDENGESVKRNYLVSSMCGDLHVKQRPITVSTASDEKIYDATPLTNPGWVVSTKSQFDLPDGHVIDAPTPYGSITNVGTASNDYSGEVHILNASGEDVTDNFIITATLGTLRVRQRPITVTTADVELIYDGQTHTYNEILLAEGTLCDGHSFVVTYAATFRDVVTDAKISLSFRICDAEGNNVRSNYRVTSDWGSITIHPRPITISNLGLTKNESYIYDGRTKLYSDIAVTEGSICEMQSLLVTSNISFKDVITDAEIKLGYDIVDEYDNSVLDNYDVTEDWKTITIDPRPITLSNLGLVENESYIYDGKAKVYADIAVTEGSICEMQSLLVTRDIYFKDVITDAEIKLGYDIVDEYGNSVLDNYDVTEDWKTITIAPRPITLSNLGLVENESYIYDGKAKVYTEIAVTEGSICEMQSLLVTRDIYFKDVITDAEIKLGYDIVDEYGNSVLDNYDVTEDWKTITIAPRPITLSNLGLVENESYIYDGKAKVYTDIAVTEGSICEMQSLLVTSNISFKNVITDAEIKLGYDIVDEYGSSVLDNYDVTEDWKTITISPRPITITNRGLLDNVSLIYDGKTRSYSQIEIIDGTLCDGHTLRITRSTTFKDVVTDEEIAIVYTIIDENKTNVLSNYDVTEVWKTITISPRPITVTNRDLLADTTWVYDGKGYSFKEVDIIEGTLCDGHKIRVTGYFMFKNVIEESAAEVKFTIVDASSYNVTTNYDITYEWKTVTITPRPITLQTESYNAVYDGKEHNLNHIEIVEGTLCDGHSISAKDSIFKNVITTVNNVKFSILDENSDDVTRNYEITLYLGEVVITKKPLLIDTESMSWKYDGKPHSYPHYVIKEGYEPIEGHELSVSECTEITEVGEKTNKITLAITDGTDVVTRNYDIQTVNYGTLVIEDDNPGGGGSGGGGGGGGTGPAPQNGVSLGLPEGFGESEPIVVFILTADSTGSVYLKEASYGDYTGQGWKKAPVYDKLLEDLLSAYYLTSKAAQNSGAGVSMVQIESLYNTYVIPYYALENNALIQKSDTCVSGDASTPYVIYYINSYDTLVLPENAVEFERLYSQFVYDNYLRIGSYTNEYLQKIIAENGFDKNDPNIINKVAKYIQGSAKYDLEYDRTLDSSDDIVVAFLETYKSGVCQHYASAATMLYRALGIPARYTVGYSGLTEEGKSTEVTNKNAHAWVEVYLDGIGWIQVEVTGSGEGGSGGGIPEEDSEEIIEIVVTPTKQIKIYDGQPLVAKNEIIITSVIQELLAKGYTYEVTVSGSITQVGVGKSTVDSFKVFNAQGDDVTHKFKIEKEEGVLEIVAKGIIDIYIYQKELVYDGTEKGYSPDEYIVLNLPDYAELVINSINIKAANTVAISSEQITASIYDYIDFTVYEDGVAQVQGCYTVRVVNFADSAAYAVFTIKQREITITTSSASKPYDGEELVDPNYHISIGMLGEGHTMELSVTGTIITKGENPNTINKESLVIKDENGNDVTDNYKVNYVLGTLKIY